MAQSRCLFLTGTFILVLAAGQSNSQSGSNTGDASPSSSSSSSSVVTSYNFGYFNGTSLVTLRSSTWDLRSAKEITFRTCVPDGTFLEQTASDSSASGDATSFRLHLQNGSVLFEWQTSGSSNSSSSADPRSVSVGAGLADNQQYTVRLKYYLGTVYLNVTQFSSAALYSAVVANSSFNGDLLNAGIRSTDLFVGRQFVGCLYGGPGVNFNGDMGAENVTWNSCPLQGTQGCSIEDQDSDDCVTVPCLNGGTCRDLFQSYVCDCPRNFNGTNCEIDLARQFGCEVSPCLNNGTCHSLAQYPNGALPYRCVCQQGYTGTNCETELDECQRSPCGRGVCINLVNSYRCNCTGTGFQGANCSEDINECATDVCGPGQCYNIPGSFSCDCPAGLDGPSCQDINECVSSPCQNGGTCQDGPNNYTCACVPGYRGINCEEDIDDCANQTCEGLYSECQDGLQTYTCVCQAGYSGTPPSCTEINECDSGPCQNDASCTDQVNAYRCDCVLGFTGDNCEHNIDDCASMPCENNATCLDGVNSYRCDCVDGFTGFNCSTNIDDCINHQCQNGATCIDLVADSRCDCAVGWTGPTCEVDFDECASRPCRNSATCHDFLGFYNCTCVQGFAGDDCGTNINECQPDPCQNGATCDDMVNDFKCHCPPEFMGKTCNESYDACSFLPCQNNATCSTTIPSRQYTCTCVLGFTGNDCEINIDNCEGNQCESYQHCYDGINTYTCACPIGYEGPTCETDIDECASNPCQNGATCVNGTGNYTCQCKLGPDNPNKYLTGYTGVNCEEDINECDYSPSICLNEGTCSNLDGSYSCSCPGQTSSGTLVTGYNCEIVTSYCIASGGSPCKNGATCQSITAGYVCHCVPGYSDKNCSTNIDECDSSPCQYGGTCHDGINGYTCDCILGITGDNCETNIDDCAQGPCNTGTCFDQINDFYCNCYDTGFEGDFCEKNINDCKPDSCRHNGTCVDGVKNFTCDCLDAYTGWRCDTDILECESNPCWYGGTCLEYSNQTLYQIDYPGFSDFSYATAAGYKCECILGTEGVNCEINIDDCVEGACENGATCEDLINNYSCVCAPGYTGRRCETDIDECEEYRPCHNGATCVDEVADYSCQCLEFSRTRDKNYGGKNCSVELQGCAEGSPCGANGYCIPFLLDEANDLHDYRCQCDPGFTGRGCGISTTMTFNASGSEMYYLLNENTRGRESFSFRFRTTLANAVLVVYTFSREILVSLEIHNKNLEIRYHDSAGYFGMAVDAQEYVNNAEWHHVQVVLAQNISVTLVSDACGSERCPQQFSYPRGKPSTYAATTGLYFGNMPSELLSKTGANRTYVGCMEDIIYDNTYLFAGQQAGVYTRMFPGCPRSTQCGPYTCNRHGDCVDLWDSFHCECSRPWWGRQCGDEYTVATFNKDGIPSSAVFDLGPLGISASDLDLSFFLRTRQDSSIIMYLGSEDPSQSPHTFVTLELQNGLLGSRLHLCSWEENYSPADCLEKGSSNFIQLLLTDVSLLVKVNGSACINTTLQQSTCQLQPSKLYLGMAPSTVVNGGGRRRRQANQPEVSLDQLDSFNGVIQDVQVKGYKLDFYDRNDSSAQDTIPLFSQQNLTTGAESTESVCNTSSPCENGGTCANVFFNDFECDCPPGYLGKNCSQPDFCKATSCPASTTCRSLQRGFECVSAATFDGFSSMVVYRASLPNGLPSQRISFAMRTRSFYGAIFETRLNNRFIKVRVWDGTIEVNYQLKATGRSDVLRLSAHKPVNDGEWYDVEVSISDANEISLRMIKNGTIEAESRDSLTDTVIDLETLVKQGTVYVGDVAAQKEQSFRGCLREVRVGGLLLPFILNQEMNNQEALQFFSATSLLSVSRDCQDDSNVCQGNLCRHGAACINVWNDYECQCPTGYTGQYCQDDVDECFAGACQNNGVCQDAIGTFTCVCRRGYIGTRCETAVDVCANASCANGSNCVVDGNVVRGYTCTCTDSNYTGENCDVQIQQNCSDGLCQNGGTCSDTNDQNVSSFSCSCIDGYTGPLCGLRIDYCADLPCEQGTCVNLPSNTGSQNFTCHCPPGYTGPQCEVDINNCTNVTCNNGGICEDKINDYFCNCTNGWEGQHCDVDVDECSRNVCMHGQCHNRDGGFFCDCTGTGYSGPHCEDEINECELGFCKHGLCNDTEGSFDCTCDLGYEGENCSVPVCETGLCENGGTCSTNDTDWICTCPEFYAGRRCEHEGPCVSQPCHENNTRTCVQQSDFYTNNNSDNFTCECNSGWEGDTCSEDIDECSGGSDPCENGATCENTDGSFRCRCAPGYSGERCQTDIDECLSQPCKNGGSCTEGIDMFTCDCTNTGYNGTTCEEDINECLTDQVCGNGNCINTNGSFACDCGNAYLGDRCQHANPCDAPVCKNGGSCSYTLSSDGGGYDFICACMDGYGGNTCEQSHQEDDDINVALIVVPILAVIVVGIIIAVIAFVMVARKKRATRGAYSPSQQETAGSRVELGNVLKKPPEERLI